MPPHADPVDARSNPAEAQANPAEATADPALRALREASRRVVRELGMLRPRIDPTGTRPAHCHALIELGETERLSVRELADRLRVDKSAASRTADRLVRDGLAATAEDPRDRRVRSLRLTADGARRLASLHQDADQQVAAALDTLSPRQRRAVREGMELYAQALERGRRRAGVRVRRIEARDDAAMARIIREVMTEHGACGPGFAIHDAEVDHMSAAYQGARRAYFVAERDGTPIGGGGIAPLDGGDPSTCELRKMYFLPEARGLGLGAQTLRACLAAAREAGYRTCYLETLRSMSRARDLYLAFGFRRADAAQGNTGHFACDAWFTLDLTASPDDVPSSIG